MISAAASQERSLGLTLAGLDLVVRSAGFLTSGFSSGFWGEITLRFTGTFSSGNSAFASFVDFSRGLTFSAGTNVRVSAVFGREEMTGLVAVFFLGRTII